MRILQGRSRSYSRADPGNEDACWYGGELILCTLVSLLHDMMTGRVARVIVLKRGSIKMKHR